MEISQTDESPLDVEWIAVPKMSKFIKDLATVGFGVAVILCGTANVGAVPPSGSSAHSHYERPITKGGPYKDRVIVFVHGIFGDADST